MKRKIVLLFALAIIAINFSSCFIHGRGHEHGHGRSHAGHQHMHHRGK